MKNKYPKKVGILKCLCASILIPFFGMNTGFSQFTDTLEIPHLLDSRQDSLFIDIEYHDFGVAGLDSIQTLAYNYEGSQNNSYLGPTLTWVVGDTQSTYLLNRLPSGSGMITTVHWHGANIPAWTDGGPHQYFLPDSSFEPKFKVIDAPTTLWYHPHGEDVTYTQVQMGLAGIIIVKDPNDTIEPIVPHQYGIDDIPLIVQDIYFPTDSAGNTTIDTTRGPRGSASKRQLLVNGTIQPYLEVPPQAVRFRILNGSTRNSYMIGVVTDTTSPATSKLPLHLLSSDGGYLPDSLTVVDSIETSPGTRNGIIVDFSQHAGETLYAMNFPGDLRPDVVGNSQPPAKSVFLQIRVGMDTISPVGMIPTSLPPIPAIDTASVDSAGNSVIPRTITLSGKMGSDTVLATKYAIDSNQYRFKVVNTIVELNTTEDWTISNVSDVAHPFHIHLVQFYVIKVEDSSGVCHLGEACFPAEYLGPKDDILVHPGEKVTFRVRFHTYGRPKPFDEGPLLDSAAYMYHCHILTHEDGYYIPNPSTISARSPFGMMQQFVVWNGDSINTSIEEPLDKEMVLFPNPAGDMLHLNAESPRLTRIRMRDIQGRLLMEQMLPPFSGTKSFSVGHLARGMIIVEWLSKDSRQVKKIVLE